MLRVESVERGEEGLQVREGEGDDKKGVEC